MLFTEYTDDKTGLLDTPVCEMPGEDDDLDDDFDEAWDKETGEDELFNDGIETDEFSLEDEPGLDFDEEDGEDDDY